MGSVTPSDAEQIDGVWPYNAWTTVAYREFQSRQIEELTTQYGPLVEFWLDIPSVLGPEGRERVYQQIAAAQPDCVIVTNAGLQDTAEIELRHNWPTDVVTLERALPTARHAPWRKLGRDLPSKDWHYLPAEANDPIGREWFYEDDDPPRSHAELLAMRLMCEARGVNLLLNVPPDRSGRLPPRYIDALIQLQRSYRLVQS
jgi:alpha-L-fucosidase